VLAGRREFPSREFSVFPLVNIAGTSGQREHDAERGGKLPEAREPLQEQRSAAARRGLTLIELLVSVALLSLVSATVVATFIGGIQVWERLEGYGQRERWLQLAFHQIRHDVRNLRVFTPVAFDGQYDEWIGAAMVPGPPPRPGDPIPLVEPMELGRLGYFFDSNHRRLCRASDPYRTMRNARLRDECQVVLSDVRRVRFSYYGHDPNSHELSWLNRWEQPQPPLAVKVEIRYDDPATKRPVDRALIVTVPVYRPPDGDADSSETST
jgi:prepilin-type N-terminal cleavage/methylation domain-containing protein